VNFVTPTIGLTGTFIVEKSVSSLIKELTSECSGAARLFVKEERFCKRLTESCFNSWKEILSCERKFQAVLNDLKNQ
jgi:hypothetical protein